MRMRKKHLSYVLMYHKKAVKKPLKNFLTVSLIVLYPEEGSIAETSVKHY